MAFFNFQVENFTDGDFYSIPINGLEHRSSPSLTTHYLSLVSVLEARIAWATSEPRVCHKSTLPLVIREAVHSSAYKMKVYWNFSLNYRMKVILWSISTITQFGNYAKYVITLTLQKLFRIFFFQKSCFPMGVVSLSFNFPTSSLQIYVHMPSLK